MVDSFIGRLGSHHNTSLLPQRQKSKNARRPGLQNSGFIQDLDYKRHASNV